MKKPEPKDFGYEDGGIEMPTGWSIEGGEEAYYDAIKKWEGLQEIKPIDILKNYEHNGTLTDEDICYAMQEYHCKMANAYKQRTVDSLKSSLMDRFKQMQHASEERYATEAAKFFAWIIDSWKREENLL